MSLFLLLIGSVLPFIMFLAAILYGAKKYP